MIGIDTNVLLRLFGRDEPEAKRARAADVIAQGYREGGVLLNPIVLCEFAWTLARSYKLPRADIAQRLERLLDAREIAVPGEAQVREAVERYRSGRADFADYLIAAQNRHMSCRTTVTFDQDAGDSPDMTALRYE